MGKLVIFAGASGAGKSFLLEYLSNIDSSLEIIMKKTTRSPRPYEDNSRIGSLDLELECSREMISKCKYRYSYSSEYYGISKKEIDSSLQNGKNPVCIVRDCETIHHIKKDYPNSLVLYIQSGLSGKDLEQKLKDQGRDDIEIEERMKRLQRDFADYVRYIHLFDYVIVNYYEQESLISQAREILRERINQEEIDLNFIFVLMSFDPALDEVYKALCLAGRLISNVKLKIQRMDVQKGDYKITDQILENIRKAGLIIADFSMERPNVYYELGYARGIGKTVLHCAKAGTKLHFDIQDFHTIFYNSPMHLQELITDELYAIYNN